MQGPGTRGAADDGRHPLKARDLRRAAESGKLREPGLANGAHAKGSTVGLQDNVIPRTKEAWTLVRADCDLEVILLVCEGKGQPGW